MPLYIKNPEAEQLARQLAAITGDTVTNTVIHALEKLAHEQPPRKKRHIDIDKVMAIIDHCASLPVLDDRSADEILGYDDIGLPT